MNGVLRWMVAICAVSASLGGAAVAGQVSGPARLVDGDTLEVGGQMVRLAGIDAPETGQRCQDAQGRDYPCGESAVEALQRLVRNRPVTCEGREYDRYDRLIGTCWAAGTALNSAMVKQGWAVAFTRFSEQFLPEELDAAKAGRGLWLGRFQRPEEFRAQRWRAAETKSPEGCPIKGNISTNGRIYHTPWSRWYARTRINTNRGERWFCTEAEAIAAGWRPAHR
ncbi:MAG: thermonuclease family protein [Pseudomonadota bacterium]